LDGPCAGLPRAWSSSKGDADAAATPTAFLRLAPPSSDAAKGGGGRGSLRPRAEDDADGDARTQEAIGMWAGVGCAARLVYARRASAGRRGRIPGTPAVAIDKLWGLAASPRSYRPFLPACVVAKLESDSCAASTADLWATKGISWTAGPGWVGVWTWSKGWNCVDVSTLYVLVHVSGSTGLPPLSPVYGPISGEKNRAAWQQDALCDHQLDVTRVHPTAIKREVSLFYRAAPRCG
jgi:hypothetical protein